MAVDAKFDEVHLERPGKDLNPEPPNKVQYEVQRQMLDAIYDEKPLGFEKDLLENNAKMLAQDPIA